MYVIDAMTTPSALELADVADEVLDVATVPVDDPSLAQRSGTGAWPNGDRAVRTGSCEEVLVTVAGARLAAIGDIDPNLLFDPAIKRLTVDQASLRRSRHELAWDVHLRTVPGRQRRASMRIYTSPSGNVTVLTLVPRITSKMFPTAFIRPGLRALRKVGARLERLTTPTP